MSLVGFAARNHPQQVASRGARDGVDDRRTPRTLWLYLSGKYGPFDLDAAANDENALCPRYFTIERSGLVEPWFGVVWCNPPFSDVGSWVRRAWEQAPNCQRIVMVLPANRTEQGWWQTHVEPYRDGRSTRDGIRLTTEFLRSRINFATPGRGKYNSSAPFGCVLLILDADPAADDPT